jgi:putative nucleotidyltransferase with HDIG domain
MIDRPSALEMLHREIPQVNLIKHLIATEAVMKGLAEEFGEDVELWGRTGLLHDLDYARTMDDPARHARLSVEMLGSEMPDTSLHAILAHCGHIPAESRLDKALRCADPVTGLITAAALMHPSRKLAAVEIGFLMKRFKEKRFAAGADRDQIAECQGIGLDLEKFLTLALWSMQAAAEELGL